MKNRKRKIHKNIPRFRVEEREGNPHGDVYELEITTYFDVIDNHTNKVVMTFSGEYSAHLESGGWGDGSYWGVEKVEIVDDDQHALVYETNKKEPRKVKLPVSEK